MRLQKWFGPIVINSMDETTSESSRVAFFLASADSLFCASHKIIVFFIHFFAQKNRNCTGLTKLLLQKSFFQTHWAGFTDVFFSKNSMKIDQKSLVSSLTVSSLITPPINQKMSDKNLRALISIFFKSNEQS